MSVNPSGSVQEPLSRFMVDVLGDVFASPAPGSSIPAFCNKINTKLNYTSVLLSTKL